MGYLDKYKSLINFNENKLENDDILNDEIEFFKEYVDNAPNSYWIHLYNDVNVKVKCTIQDVRFNDKEKGDEKALCTYLETELNVGDIIILDDSKKLKNEHWLILFEEDNTIKSHRTFTIKPCNHILKWLNSKGDICSSPVIIEKADMYTDGLYDNNKIKVGDTKILVTFPANDNTNQINIGKRFILDTTHAYEVSNTGATSPKGLKQMIMTQTEIHQGVDNLDLLIADFKDNVHDYKIEILNNNIILSTNSTYELQVRVYDKNNKIDNPELNFTISNKDIISIENNIITGVKEGNTIIYVQFKDITESINIQVIKGETNNYTCVIEGKNELSLGRTRDYIGKFFNNGMEIEDVCIWNITDKDNNDTNFAKIIKTENNKCTIKVTNDWIFNDNLSKYFYLHLQGTTGKEYIKQVKIIPY